MHVLLDKNSVTFGEIELKNVGLEADTTNFHDKTYLLFKLIIVVKTRNVKKLKFLFPLSIFLTVVFHPKL